MRMIVGKTYTRERVFIVFGAIGTLSVIHSTVGIKPKPASPAPQAGLSSLSELGQSFARVIGSGIENFQAPYHRHGETNRYSKDLNIPLSDGPPIEKPKELVGLAYTRHRYSPLYTSADLSNADHKPVRILELLQSTDGDGGLVRCKLHTHLLDGVPAYEAISYAWGIVNTQDYPVVIVGRNQQETEAVPVTKHLYAALLRLRQRDRSRFLWADQICINQDDKVEKGRQVKQMGQIYAKSSRTVIWLGEEDPSSLYGDMLTEVFTYLRAHPNNSLELDKVAFKNMIDFTNPMTGFFGPFPTETPAQKRREAITRLLNRTWFSRVWVFQEAVVSPDVQVMLGSQTILLKDLFRLVRAVFEHEDEAGGYFRSIAKRTAGFDTLYLIQHHRDEGCGEANCPRAEVPKTFFGLVMQALQQLKSTKSLDLIYAFVGFQKHPIVEIDYNQEVRTVWMNATKEIIKQTHSLDVFAAARGHSGGGYNLPSWVPDFSNLYPHARPITAPDFMSSFNSCGGIPHTWTDPDGAETLTVRGINIGSIMYRSAVNMDQKSNRDEALGTKAVLQYHLHHENYVGTVYRQNNSSVTLDQIVRTLLADGAFGHEQPLTYPIEEIIRVCEEEDRIQAAYDAGTRITDYKILEKVREWGLIAQQKYLYVSDQLELVLAPKVVDAGDIVCLLHGSKVPCVLRQVDGDQGKYRIISQCYVDGQMYNGGSSRWREKLRSEPTTFLLV